MPKAKLTDEEKQALFDTWQEGPEWKCIDAFCKKRGTVPMFEMSTKDISDDFQPFLSELF